MLTALRGDRTYVTSVNGIGGTGKTALAHWGVLESYKSHLFDFIISVSAKDRELLPSGIQPLTPILTSFAALLDEILDVTGLGDLKHENEEVKENEIRSIITGEPFLLFIDNLETIDDARLLHFLETLPKPVKAIITSRRARVRHSVYPIDVGVFAMSEALRFLEIQAERRGHDFILDLPPPQKEAIVQACSRLPLGIEWLVGQADTPDKANNLANALTGSGRVGEELLEFCFRRIHDDLSPSAKRCLAVLSVFEKAESLEPIAAGAQLPHALADDALDELRACALVEVVHDSRLNLLTYTMLPLTKKFAYSGLVRDQREEAEIRRALTRHFEAFDIADPNQRRLVSEVRMGLRDPDTELLNLAIALKQAGRHTEAERYYLDAISRNPKSWRAHREAAEYYRHPPISNMREALRLYEQAVALAPRKGRDRGLILREFGILLRDSGVPGAMTKARDVLDEALREFSGRDDSICRHALGDVYQRLQMRRKAAEVLEPLINHPYEEQRRKTYPLLEELYRLLGEQVKLVELRDRMARERREGSE